MKVWERIRDEAEKEEFILDSIDKVKNWMYDNRVIACDMNDTFKIIDTGSMNKLCNECELDCYTCLENYLNLEVQNESE